MGNLPPPQPPKRQSENQELINQQWAVQDPKYSNQFHRQDALFRKIKDQEKRVNLQLSRPGSNLAKQARLNSKFEQAKQDPITNTYMAGMISLALFFDIVSGIINFTGIGTIVTDIFIAPLAIVSLYYFYRMKGIDFGSSKVLLRFWGTVVLKFIPLLNIIPEYTLNVLLVTSVERFERKTGIYLPRK